MIGGDFCALTARQEYDPGNRRRHITAQATNSSLGNLLRGVSFSSLLHSTRSGLAEHYLANDRYSMTDVSQLLGFTAPSAFTRWFHQQFGMSPSAWRSTSRT